MPLSILKFIQCVFLKEICIMKRIIFAFITASLLLVGCSDKSNENTSDNISKTSAASETTDSDVSTSNTTAVKATSANNAGDSDEKTDSGASSDKTVQTDSDNTIVSGDELPILAEETSKDSDNSESENKPSETKNTSPSSETETQTTAAEKENGGVIELPIIPVK